MRFPAKTGTRFFGIGIRNDTCVFRRKPERVFLESESESESKTMHAFSGENWNTFFWNRNQNQNRKRCMRFPMKTGTRFLESESESESETMRRVYAIFSAVCEIAGQRKIIIRRIRRFRMRENPGFCRNFIIRFRMRENPGFCRNFIIRFRMRENPGFCRNTICLPFLAPARCGDISAY